MTIRATALPDAGGPWPLWREGFTCALKNLPHNRSAYTFKQSVRLLACPVDLWRYHEFAAVLAYHRPEDTALDLSSPKVLSRHLARHRGATVCCADIAPYHAEEAAWYARGLTSAAGRLLPLTMRADAIALPAGAVPFVFSVSVVEHIGGNGDSRAMAEIGRVLKPGGTAVVTVPLYPDFGEVWLQDDVYQLHRGPRAPTFFSYHYDWSSIEQRLAGPSGLRLAALHIWRAKDVHRYERYRALTNRYRTARALLAKTRDVFRANTLLEPYEGDPADIGAPGVAALVLRNA